MPPARKGAAYLEDGTLAGPRRDDGRRVFAFSSVLSLTRRAAHLCATTLQCQLKPAALGAITKGAIADLVDDGLRFLNVNTTYIAGQLVYVHDLTMSKCVLRLAEKEIFAGPGAYSHRRKERLFLRASRAQTHLRTFRSRLQRTWRAVYSLWIFHRKLQWCRARQTRLTRTGSGCPLHRAACQWPSAAGRAARQ